MAGAHALGPSSAPAGVGRKLAGQRALPCGVPPLHSFDSFPWPLGPLATRRGWGLWFLPWLGETPVGKQASGVAVSDGVIKVFNDMKVRKSSTPEEVKKRKKAVLFCLSEDKKNIVLEEGKEILVGDVGQTVEDPYATFVQMLPDKDCRYALYDATYETKESKKEDLVFIFWAPECAPLKSKMIYASSKDAIKKKLTGIKHELQANCYEEVKDRCTLAEKLGGSAVISLEGKPL